MAGARWPTCCVIKPERPSPALRQAIVILDRNRCGYEEIDEDAMFSDDATAAIDAHKGKGHIFVVESFKNEAFKFLVSRKCRVIGPMCVVHCGREREALPLTEASQAKVPVLSCAMRGVVACCTGLQQTERKGIYELVQMMDGSVQRVSFDAPSFRFLFLLPIFILFEPSRTDYA